MKKILQHIQPQIMSPKPTAAFPPSTNFASSTTNLNDNSNTSSANNQNQQKTMGNLNSLLNNIKTARRSSIVCCLSPAMKAISPGSVTKLGVSTVGGNIPITKALSNVARSSTVKINPGSAITIGGGGCGCYGGSGNGKQQNLGSLKNGHEIKIRIISNWGNSDLVSCSKIEVLSVDNSPCTIKKFSISPLKQDSKDFDKLLNGTLIKEKESDVWSMKWPPDPPLKSVEIVLDVFSDQCISSLRIWPNQYDISQNIKEVIVIMDHMIFYKGEIPKDFGIVIPLKFFDQDGNSLLSTLQMEKTNKETDKWGVLPFKASTKIELHFISSYLSQTHFGLQQIMFFDQEGNWMDISGQTLIEEVECGEFDRPGSSLFYNRNEKLVVGQRRQLWKGEFKEKPRFIISFTEPTLISAIAIVTLKPVPGPVDIALKQVKIISDHTSIWTGKLKHALPEFNDERECMNVVFLYDNEKVREKVLVYCYPPIVEHRPLD